MENQHRKITGYRDLSYEEVSLMNAIKNKGAELGELCAVVATTPGIDPRWLAIGRQHLQEGLMAITRAVAQPTTF